MHPISTGLNLPKVFRNVTVEFVSTDRLVKNAKDQACDLYKRKS